MATDITVKFVDFWPSFDPFDNKLLRALAAGRKVTVLPADASEEPDILFYSRCGLGEHYKYEKAVKVYYSGENDYPNFNECDYAISFHDIDVAGRNLRYPLYALETLISSSDGFPSQIGSPSQIGDFSIDQSYFERDFCSLVMSNSINCDPRRIEIIDAIAAYKPIAYGGAFRNNVGGRVASKEDFLRKYKFNLALENSILDGYVTEKIADAFVARTVPIYWGGAMACKDFNPESFINVEDYNSVESCVRAVAEIDRDPARYTKMLNAPSRMADRIIDFDSRLETFLAKIADERRIYRTNYGEIGLYKQRYSIVHPLSQRRIYLRISRLLGRILQPSYFGR